MVQKIGVGKMLLSLALRFTLTLFTVSCGTNLMAQQLDVDPALRTQGASYGQNARACPADAIKILLIGNSYTHYYRMPETLEKLLNAHADKDMLYCVRHHAPGGHTLFKDHLPYFQKPNNPFVFDWEENCRSVEKQCASPSYRQWDHIVIQGHSYYHSLSERKLHVREKLNDSLRALAQIFSGSKNRFYLFMTWAYQNGHQKGIPNYGGYFRDFDSMQDSIGKAYNKSCETLAESVDTDVIPVGNFFQAVSRKNTHNFSALYTTDGRHPSRLGSFFIAAILARHFLDIPDEKPKYVPPLIELNPATYFWKIAGGGREKMSCSTK